MADQQPRERRSGLPDLEKGARRVSLGIGMSIFGFGAGSPVDLAIRGFK